MPLSAAKLLTEPVSTGVNTPSASVAPASLASATAVTSTELANPLTEPESTGVAYPLAVLAPASLASAAATPYT